MRGHIRDVGGNEKAKINKDTLKRVFASFKKYKIQLIIITIAVLLSVVFGLLPAWYLKIIIDDGLTARNMQVVTYYTILTVIITVLGSVLTIYYGYLGVVVGQSIMRDLRNKLFDHLLNMSLRFFTSTRTGDIQTRLISDVGGVQGVVTDTYANVLSNAVTVFSTIIMMFVLDWRLTLLSIGVVPLFAYIGAKMGAYARGLRRTTQEQMGEVTSIMQETLSVSGALLLKTTGRRDVVMDRFANENQSLTKYFVKTQMIQYYFFGLMRMIFSLVPAVVYWVAGLLVMQFNENITIGTLVTYTFLQSRMFFPLTGLLTSQVEINTSLAMFDRIFEYLDIPQDITDCDNPVLLDEDNMLGAVEFKQVNFSYTPNSVPPTLQDISFKAEPGQLVALVGPSGAGKTTLTYLIPRLYDVDNGQVLIDGIDARDIQRASLAKVVGAVTQETYLMHTTIRDNLRIAKPNASDDELISAATMAAIHDHIMSLPEGYDTVVGERGYKLSGGEKQRIAIARALLKNPKILILDEATSALDTVSERLIQASLSNLMRGRTTFAIAHRLSTILAADLILVLNNGVIVERGRHSELLALNGLYAKLYHEQYETESRLTAEPEQVG